MQELLECKKGLHRTILIVDDEFIAREMLGAMLKNLYEVIYAENGAVVADVNRFHVINELYGRAYGDVILKTIGDSIHELISRTGGLACRSDSDRFCSQYADLAAYRRTEA